MVCAIRPGHPYYEETLNTLKYADRAKKIKNKPVVNESPQDKLIKELQEENRRLKESMGQGGAKVAVGVSGGNDDLAKQKAELEAKLRALEEREKSWAEKLAAAEQDRAKDDKDADEEVEIRNSGRP
jgi:outer membrane murein-binding lipoprotein Lpp